MGRKKQHCTWFENIHCLKVNDVLMEMGKSLRTSSVWQSENTLRIWSIWRLGWVWKCRVKKKLRKWRKEVKDRHLLSCYLSINSSTMAKGKLVMWKWWLAAINTSAHVTHMHLASKRVTWKSIMFHTSNKKKNKKGEMHRILFNGKLGINNQWWIVVTIMFFISARHRFYWTLFSWPLLNREKS